MEERNKVLFLIADNYPFGYGETFLENEIGILANKFKKVYIVSRNEKDNQTRKVPNNCEVIRLDTNKFKKKYKIKILAILLDKYYLIDWLKNKAKRKIRRYQFTAKAIEEKILEVIKQENLVKEEIIAYSYWFYYGAYAVSMLKRKNIVSKAISRANGYDIFLERGPQYLKIETLKNIDLIFPACKNSEKYLKELYPNFKNKINYSYLGVVNPIKNFEINKNIDNRKILVSCSNIISLKRVELIIKSLKEIKNKTFLWVHIGDGEKSEEIKLMAEKSLLKGQFKFLGEINNKEVLNYYSRNKDSILCMLHFSSTEGGVPVSMMEVQSFGIPIIATDVGGVREIVNSKTGILLPSNPEINEIVDALKEMLDLSQERYNEYQRNSYENWKENFNAEINYEKFVEELLESREQ